MLDSLPEASLGFRSILLQICFVNQAFLEFQFFHVQGSYHAFLVKKDFSYYFVLVDFSRRIFIGIIRWCVAN
jgi:hypothetical protein